MAAACAAMLMLVGAPAGMAQSASQGGYDESAPLGQVENAAGDEASGGPDAAGGDVADGVEGDVENVNVDEQSTLPFTGMDLGVMLLVGALLVGTGLLVRRASRSASV